MRTLILSRKRWKILSRLSLDVNKSNTEEFFKLANDKFQGLSKESDKNLETKKKLIDENLNEMSKRLKSIEDASIKLNENLESTNSQTKDLTETTIKLREIYHHLRKEVNGVSAL